MVFRVFGMSVERADTWEIEREGVGWGLSLFTQETEQTPVQLTWTERLLLLSSCPAPVYILSSWLPHITLTGQTVTNLWHCQADSCQVLSRDSSPCRSTHYHHISPAQMPNWRDFQLFSQNNLYFQTPSQIAQPLEIMDLPQLTDVQIKSFRLCTIKIQYQRQI